MCNTVYAYIDTACVYRNCDGPASTCQSDEVVPLELEVASLTPRVFMIENFLSDFETEEIIRLASPKLHHSSVGDVASGVLTSDTRTSSNAWVPRKSSAVTESLFLRAADLLQIDETLLHSNKNAEDMQVCVQWCRCKCAGMFSVVFFVVYVFSGVELFGPKLYMR